MVLILVFGPVSGAHFNPAVTLAFALRGEFAVARRRRLYRRADRRRHRRRLDRASDVRAAAAGSSRRRRGPAPAQWLAEAVATFGLLLTIFGCLAARAAAIPYAVGLYITAAYWFTASTSFANPAVTIARALSDTFAGIAPAGVPAFIVAQLVGAAMATALAAWLWPKPATVSP